MLITQMQPEDLQTVQLLVQAAFENAPHTDHNEHHLVKKLYESPSFIKELALICKENDEIIGFVLFTKIKIGHTDALALAPIAIQCDKQGQGIGGLLINEGHRIAKMLGYEFIVVLGDDQYYSKFGYDKASMWGIIPPFDAPDENYLAINLLGNKTLLDACVYYDKAFGI